MHNACGILWRSDATASSLLHRVYYLLRILAACCVDLRDWDGAEGWVPSHYEFRTARPRRLLIEPQILAISRGVWKSLSAVGSEMYRTDAPSPRYPAEILSSLSMNRNEHEHVAPRGDMRFHSFVIFNDHGDGSSFSLCTMLFNIYIYIHAKLVYQILYWF